MSGAVPPDMALSIGALDPQGLGEGLSGDPQVEPPVIPGASGGRG